jgi:hypothetical protein
LHCLLPFREARDVRGLCDEDRSWLLGRSDPQCWITHDQINAALSSSDQIEDAFVTLSEMCINVVQNEEAETEEADDGKDG